MRLAYTALAFCVLSTALVAAEKPYLGTWKLNTEKSKYNPGPGPKDETLKFEADGNNIKRTVTGTDAQDQPIMEGGPEGISLAWDGQEHPINKPSDPPMTVAVTQVNPHTLHVLVKQQGKITDTIHVVVSQDGKTLTSRDKGTNAKGEKISSVEVFDKE
jgi:hypothetical protein